MPASSSRPFRKHREFTLYLRPDGSGRASGELTGDSQILLTALNSMREITHYSSSHRCFTEQQRLAIIARDQHCTGPGCDDPHETDDRRPRYSARSAAEHE
ncbi:MAG: hypothetical protein ABI345_04855 [Jatrophihabitans sp.]